MRLIDLISPEHVVVPLAATSLREAVQELMQRLVVSGAVRYPERLERLTTEERIRDVVHVGDRVLLPHMRTPAVEELAIAIGITAVAGQIEATNPDGAVRVVVLVLAPPTAANRYLQIVAALTRALRAGDTVDALAAASTAEEVRAVPALRDLEIRPALQVRDVMTPRVYRVYPETPVRELLELTGRHALKSVPVVNQKREVLGIVTDRDILRHLLPGTARGDAPVSSGPPDDALLDVPVRDIMSRSVMCIPEDQPLVEVISVMVNKNVDRLPVVAEGKLTGFLTRGDVLQKLFGR